MQEFATSDHSVLFLLSRKLVSCMCCGGSRCTRGVSVIDVVLCKLHWGETSPSILIFSILTWLSSTVIILENGYLPKVSRPRTEWGRDKTYYKAINDWALLPSELKRLMPKTTCNYKLKQFLLNHFEVSLVFFEFFYLIFKWFQTILNDF